MKCKYCECSADQEPGKGRCNKCGHDAVAHTSSNTSRRWLALAIIIAIIAVAAYYSKRGQIQSSQSQPVTRSIEPPPAPLPAIEPANAPPAPPPAPWQPQSQTGPQSPPIQPGTPPAVIPQPNAPGVKDIPNPSPLDPSGHPLGIFCPPDTTSINGQCVPNRALPPGLLPAK